MSDEAARKKYDEALRCIEDARAILAEAAEALSALIGAVDQWALVVKHHELTGQLWRKVAYSYVAEDIHIDRSKEQSS